MVDPTKVLEEEYKYRLPHLPKQDFLDALNSPKQMANLVMALEKEITNEAETRGFLRRFCVPSSDNHSDAVGKFAGKRSVDSICWRPILREFRGSVYDVESGKISFADIYLELLLVVHDEDLVWKQLISTNKVSTEHDLLNTVSVLGGSVRSPRTPAVNLFVSSSVLRAPEFGTGSRNLAINRRHSTGKVGSLFGSAVYTDACYYADTPIFAEGEVFATCPNKESFVFNMTPLVLSFDVYFNTQSQAIDFIIKAEESLNWAFQIAGSSCATVYKSARINHDIWDLTRNIDK